MLTNSMLTYVFSFISGFLVKAVDWIEDDLKKPLIVRWPLALLAGAFIGYLISIASFGTIFMAALFAQVFARKVDKPSHAATVLTAALVFIFMGVNNGFEIMYFLILLVPAFLDELEYPKQYKFLNEYRVFLLLAAAIFALGLGRWDYLFGIATFDAGYLTYEKIGASILDAQKKNKEPKKSSVKKNARK